jgi:hypothetical protein
MISGLTTSATLVSTSRFPLGCVFIFLSCVSPLAFGESKLDSAKALRSINGNWWNHDNSSYNSPSTSSTYDNPLRKSGRLGEESPERQWKPWNFNLSWLGEALSYLIISILILLLAVGLVLLGMHIVRTYRPPETDFPASEIKIDPARIEELPFEATQWVGDPLAEARRLAQQGHFDQAIIYLYGYQLLALDQSRKIHLHKGKTNRMYIRELEPPLQLKEIVSLTMGKFEEVYFGKHSLTKPSFLEVWNLLDTFHSLIAQSTIQDVSGDAPAGVGVAT